MTSSCRTPRCGGRRRGIRERKLEVCGAGVLCFGCGCGAACPRRPTCPDTDACSRSRQCRRGPFERRGRSRARHPQGRREGSERATVRHMSCAHAHRHAARRRGWSLMHTHMHALCAVRRHERSWGGSRSRRPRTRRWSRPELIGSAPPLMWLESSTTSARQARCGNRYPPPPNRGGYNASDMHCWGMRTQQLADAHPLAV